MGKLDLTTQVITKLELLDTIAEKGLASSPFTSIQ